MKRGSLAHRFQKRQGETQKTDYAYVWVSGAKTPSYAAATAATVADDAVAVAAVDVDDDEPPPPSMGGESQSVTSHAASEHKKRPHAPPSPEKPRHGG